MSNDLGQLVSYDAETQALYSKMWGYVQTFPLANFIVEQNFKNWFDQMHDVGRADDIEFCVNYAKKLSGTKTYALLSEFENIKAWHIDEQSMFINARDVFENLYFVDTPAPITGDLLRGTRNEPFAREEFIAYLNDLYPANQGFTVVQRTDLVEKISNYESEDFPWFGGTPDDVFEIRHTTYPSTFIMPDYKCPKPDNITATVDPQYKHQLHHYDLGFDLIHAADPSFPLIDTLYLVKFNVETQSILVLESPKDNSYKARLVEACEFWWNEYALKGVIPPIQNDFTPIITAADFADLQQKATDAVRLRDPDFQIDPVLEEQINSIPNLLYDFSIAKKITNEMGKLASDINDKIKQSFLAMRDTGVLSNSGELTIGCGAIKWGPERNIDEDKLLQFADSIDINIDDYADRTINIDANRAFAAVSEATAGQGLLYDSSAKYNLSELINLCLQHNIDLHDVSTESYKVRTNDLLKAIEQYGRENKLDLDLSPLFTYEDGFSVALSRKKSGTVATFGDSLTNDANEILTKVIAEKNGYASHLVLQQQQEFTDRLSYQSRSQKFSQQVLSLLDEQQKYTKSPIPRQASNTSPINEYAVVTFSGDIIEVDTGEVIGNLNDLKQQQDNTLTSIKMSSDTTKASHSEHQKSAATTENILGSGAAPARQGENKIIAQVIIKSNGVSSEARGKAIAQLEHKMEVIAAQAGDKAIRTSSNAYSSDISALLGENFNLAAETLMRNGR